MGRQQTNRAAADDQGAHLLGWPVRLLNTNNSITIIKLLVVQCGYWLLSDWRPSSRHGRSLADVNQKWIEEWGMCWVTDLPTYRLTVDMHSAKGN